MYNEKDEIWINIPDKPVSYRSIDDLEARGDIIFGAGDWYFHNQQYDKAIEWYSRVRENIRVHDDHSLSVKTSITWYLAQAYYKNNNIGKAINLLVDAYELGREKERGTCVTALKSAIKLCIKHDMIEKAFQLANKYVIENPRELLLINEIIDFLSNQSEFNAFLNNLPIENINKLSDATSSLKTETFIKIVAHLIDRYKEFIEYEKKNNRGARNIIYYYHDCLDHAEEISNLQMAEKFCGIILNDAISRDDEREIKKCYERFIKIYESKDDQEKIVIYKFNLAQSYLKDKIGSSYKSYKDLMIEIININETSKSYEAAANNCEIVADKIINTEFKKDACGLYLKSAKHFEKLNNWIKAVQNYLKAGTFEDAARIYDKLDPFELKIIAEYFEKCHMLKEAAHIYDLILKKSGSEASGKPPSPEERCSNRECQKILAPDEEYCMDCGAPRKAKIRVCGNPECQTELPDGARHCKKCGKKVI